MAANAELKLGELLARVEFDTVPDDGALRVVPKKVQLVLKTNESNGYDVVVVGEIEVV